MKKNLFQFVLIYTTLVLTCNAQSISFSFTANHKCEYAASDSILIENLTQGGDTTLHWNDTTFTIIISNINELNTLETEFYVLQNSPNPFVTNTNIEIFVPEKDEFSIVIYDLSGREVANSNYILEYGLHNFTFFSGNSMSYIFTIQSDKMAQDIQMLQIGKGGMEKPQIVYNGITATKDINQKTKSPNSNFAYEIGDELRFTCYVSGDYTVITDTPTQSEEYFFDIANQAPDIPTTDVHVVSDNQIEWKWSSVAGADGFKYNFTNDYSTAIDNGINTSFVNSGLELCTAYTLYVWAYNSCGVSGNLLLTENTSGVNSSYSSPAFNGNIVKIRYYSTTATSVSLSGTMNSWAFTPLSHICGNYWEISLTKNVNIQDGDLYKLVVDGYWIYDPMNPNMISDGYGGYMSVVVFP